MKRTLAIIFFMLSFFCSLCGCSPEKAPPQPPVTDVTLSWANYTDDSEILVHALNTRKMLAGSILRLPIYCFDTLDDLQNFQRRFDGTLTTKQGYDEVPAFCDTVAKYDDAFFKDNSLLLVYIGTNNTTHRFDLGNLLYEDGFLTLLVKETTGSETVDTAMGGWFLTAAVSDGFLEGHPELDAAFQIPEEK